MSILSSNTWREYCTNIQTLIYVLTLGIKGLICTYLSYKSEKHILFEYLLGVLLTKQFVET